MIRVLVVDDHPVVSQGLVMVLGDQGDLVMVGTAASCAEAEVMVERHHPEVVLLDLELGPPAGDFEDGVALIPRLLARRPAPAVLIFTAFGSDDRIFSSLEAGASGYLLKGASVAEIATAIRRVASGESYLEPKVASRVLSRMRAVLTAPAARGSEPSERQRQVLRLVAEGMSNQQIGERLALSERTVKFHLTALFNKLNVDNRAQAVAVAGQQGWL